VDQGLPEALHEVFEELEGVTKNREGVREGEDRAFARFRAIALLLDEVLPSTALVFAFLIAGFVVEWTYPMPGFMRPLGYLPSFTFFLLAALYGTALVLVWQRWRQKARGRWIHGWQGWKVAWEESSTGLLGRGKKARLLVVSLFIPLLLNTFGSWKLAIPQWRGFEKELWVLELSRAAHGGTLAWDLLQPLLGHPFLTLVLDRIYFSWLPVFVVVVIWQGVWREPAWERKRFILAMTLVWLGLGVLAATAWASAGPIFLDRVLPGSTHYTEMLEYLTRVDDQVGLITLEVQELLWTTYRERLARPFQGISAFPSIHVSVACVYALALWKSHRRTRWFATAYAAAIAISSIHLGWHYALDIYGGALGAGACWFLAGLAAKPRGSTVA
jgi:hypothetical protein